MVHIFSGPRDQGKTTSMISYYNSLKKNGDGVASVKVFQNGNCIGYDFIHLSTSDSVPGLRLKTSLPSRWNELYKVGQYSFSKSGFDFAEKVINETFVKSDFSVWIDEVGKLELGGKGFFLLIKKAMQANRILYLCCRDSFISKIIEMFLIRDYKILEPQNGNKRIL